MAVISLVGSKVILAVCNVLLLTCGFALAAGGLLALFDGERVLLSKLAVIGGPIATLPRPPLHYVAVGLALLGLALASAGVLGCWASCLRSYCLLSFYFVIVIAILIGECAVYAMAWAWPNCVGFGIDMEELIKTLHRDYGTSGKEQFTAAIDLAQTTFNCCGIDSANEYDTSLWRLQALSPSLAVPLTCCKLRNIGESGSYLNPIPVNQTLCQALEKHRHEGYRHTVGCHDALDKWYKDHYIMFLAVGLGAVLIEFAVLLSTILTCTRIYHHNQEAKENAKNSMQEPMDMSHGEGPSNYKRQSTSTAGHPAYSNETYALGDNFTMPNYKLVDRA